MFLNESGKTENLDSVYGILAIYYLLMLFLYGILNLMNNFIESIGANFEYYVSPESHG